MKKLRIICVLLTVMLIGCGATGWKESYKLGMKLLKDGAYQEAILEFDRAIEIDAKQAVVYVGRGHAYIGLGETKENLAKALADYEMAVSLDETNADAYLGMVDVYIRRGEYDKALEILKAALAKTGKNKAMTAKIADMEAGRFKDSSGKARRINHYDVKGNFALYEIIEYNADDKISKNLFYQTDGKLVQYIEPEYDENGRKIKTFNYCTMAGKWILESTTTYEYDDDGKVIRSNVYTNNVKQRYLTYEYDWAGNNIRINEYNADGKLLEYHKYKYDADGNRTKISSYYADGTPK